MNPAWSRTSTTVLPQVSANSRASATVVVGRRDGPHDLDQRHRGRGVEEVDAADLVRSTGLHRHLDDGKGRRVRGEDRRVATDAVELGEEVLLGCEVLDDRLQHEVALGELAEVGHRADPTEHRGALGVLEAALLDLAPERLLEPRDHRVGRRLGAAAEHDLETGLARDLGDSRAHDPRPDHPEPLDRHLALRLGRTGACGPRQVTAR